MSDLDKAIAGKKETGCPDANLISAFVDNNVDDNERAQVIKHLDDCEDCRTVIERTANQGEDNEP